MCRGSQAVLHHCLADLSACLRSSHVCHRCLATPTVLVFFEDHHTFQPLLHFVMQAFFRVRTPSHLRVSTDGALVHDGGTSMLMTVKMVYPCLSAAVLKASSQALAASRVPYSVHACFPQPAGSRMYSSRRHLGWKCARDTSSTRSVCVGMTPESRQIQQVRSKNLIECWQRDDER